MMPFVTGFYPYFIKEKGNLLHVCEQFELPTIASGNTQANCYRPHKITQVALYA